MDEIIIITFGIVNLTFYETSVSYRFLTILLDST
jgi:hypothetical protein